jgi:hypothetical protein
MNIHNFLVCFKKLPIARLHGVEGQDDDWSTKNWKKKIETNRSRPNPYLVPKFVWIGWVSLSHHLSLVKHLTAKRRKTSLTSWLRTWHNNYFQHMRLIAGFPPRRPGFKTGSSHVGFVVDKVALGQVLSEYFGFPCQSSFHQVLHNHHHRSSGAGTIGQ